jgi:hypothetical protein
MDINSFYQKSIEYRNLINHFMKIVFYIFRFLNRLRVKIVNTIYLIISNTIIKKENEKNLSFITAY